MDRYRKLAEAIAAIKGKGNIPLFNAQVMAVEGESCTIRIGDIDIDEVRLKATMNGSANKVVARPKVGSVVLVGSLTGDLKDLAVLRVDEIAALEYEQDGLKIQVDSADGMVSISNNETSLKELFEMLTDLLKTFKVYTPSGPSGTPLPETAVKIEQFETAFKQILK